MKKIAVIVCIIMLASFIPCLAEIDISQYSIEDLLNLRASIDLEIGMRSADSSVLYPGRYAIGTDIAAGTYYLVGVLEDSDGYPPFVLYSESYEELMDSHYIDHRYVDIGSKWRISLEEGMVLEIQTGGCMIEEAPPLSVAP